MLLNKFLFCLLQKEEESSVDRPPLPPRGSGGVVHYRYEGESCFILLWETFHYPNFEEDLVSVKKRKQMLGYLLDFKKITPFLTSIFGINEFVFLCWLLEEGLGKMSSN